MECEHCKSVFKTQSSLNYHINNAKYCLQKRNQINHELVCIHCKKYFSSKHWFNQHKCYVNLDKIKNLYEKSIEENNKLKTINIMLDSQLTEQKEHYEKQIKELQDKLENIALSGISAFEEENKNKHLKIQYLTKKYVKKQPRIDYKEKNVIYILTTSNMKKENRYILGKAENLTNRLSTYNKSDEHEVIYYKQCLDQEKMNIAETMIFNKLKDYIFKQIEKDL